VQPGRAAAPTADRPADRTALPRRGRPPGTSARELETIALRLFAEQGFDETGVDQIAAAAGVSRRTFFRYFASKSEVLWSEFDQEVDNLRAALAATDPGLSITAAVRAAVLQVNHYSAADIADLRVRMALITSTPELGASAVGHYDAWEQAIIDFAAGRSGQPATSLYPLVLGRTTLAACRAAYERWMERADSDLTVYLDAALRALSAGLADDVFVAEPRPRTRRPRAVRADTSTSDEAERSRLTS
jgi:mycofactocin system transcriptional regulator